MPKGHWCELKSGRLHSVLIPVKGINKHLCHSTKYNSQDVSCSDVVESDKLGSKHTETHLSIN